MAVLTIRNLPDEVRDRLRLRAARAGKSMEAEVREILIQASVEPSENLTGRSLQDWVDELYGGQRPADAVSDLIEGRRREAKRDQDGAS
ncbi:MAG: Arc family DNA-binding protein [Gammaproteobacteria bacterium]|nr:Arc family DNA-binding protein [Gammaproteobacteria bacterium]